MKDVKQTIASITILLTHDIAPFDYSCFLQSLLSHYLLTLATFPILLCLESQ